MRTWTCVGKLLSLASHSDLLQHSLAGRLQSLNTNRAVSVPLSVRCFTVLGPVGGHKLSGCFLAMAHNVSFQKPVRYK